MPLSMEEGPLKEAAILTRAVENVFRKLIRLLIGRMSLTRLQEMIRIIFVEEAESKLKRERPGKNVPLTKLATLTGLDTRTLNKVIVEKLDSFAIFQNERFLKGFSPGFRVLDVWLSDKTYLDLKTGTPMVLPIYGKQQSFESLVASTISARGVTSQSILERLEENKMIVRNIDNATVKINQEGVVFVSHDELDMIDIGFWSAANLVATIANNVKASNQKERFFQRSCWTFKLNKINREHFQRKMLKFLIESHKKAKNQILPFEDSVESTNQITAGISMFYFEEDLTS